MGTQTDWNNAAAATPVNGVCGCPGLDYDGKKAFRLCNYLNILLGGNLITDPPAPDGSWDTGPIGVYSLHGAPWFPPGAVYFSLPLVYNGAYMIFQFGLGNDNPIFHIPPTGLDWFVPTTDPMWEYFFTRANDTAEFVCIWQENLLYRGLLELNYFSS